MPAKINTIRSFIDSCKEYSNYDFIYLAILHIFDFKEFMQELHNYMQETKNTPMFTKNLFYSLINIAIRDKKNIYPFLIENNKIYMEGVEHKNNDNEYWYY